MEEKKKTNDNDKKINVGGGAYIGGNVSTGGGDFVARDKVIASGERSVVIGGSVSGSAIIMGDGNIVGYRLVRTEFLVSFLRQIEETAKRLDIREDDKEEILSDINRAIWALTSTPPNRRIAIKRLSSLIDFVSEIESIEVQKKVLPDAKRALTLAENMLE